MNEHQTGLAIDFTDATHHKVVLPMAAKTEDNNGRLLFDHLTGGLRFTIENNTGTACTLATVRIVTTEEDPFTLI